MIYTVWNLLLALIWAAATADMSLSSLMIGYLVGFGVLWFMRPVAGPTRYFEKVHRTVSFMVYFVKELLLSNLRVAWDVVTPAMYMRPGVVAVPLEAGSDLEIAMLANIITLTPGTLSLGVSHDHRFLYVHSMFIDDPETLRQQIKEGFERPLLEVMR